MHWSLKNQILVRLLLLLSATIVAMTAAHIRSILIENHLRQSEQIEKIAELLASTRFPLTSIVLESMGSLSGAEFQATDHAGNVTARTRAAPALVPAHVASPQVGKEPLGAGSMIESDGQRFRYSMVQMVSGAPSRTPGASAVHIYVPWKNEWAVWWHASQTPLWIAAIILPIALFISVALANRVTRPLARLKEQVQQIAAGNIEEIEPNQRIDEVRDLNLSINAMAVQLRDHDQQLRRNERLQTLLQFGNGVAHNLRNSATGCRMAIELLAGENAAVAGSENIDVARRQLSLMENCIQTLLGLARSGSAIPATDVAEVDLFEVLDRVVFLLKPSAAHLDVRLESTTGGVRARVVMQHEDAMQLMINLISNAISAASERAAADGGLAVVRVHLDSLDGNRVSLIIADNGAGPPDGIADELFQPFVTGRREGIGLGLSLVHEIAQRVGGSVRWTRDGGETKFVFQFFGQAD